MLESALRRDRPPDHVLLSGPPGLGKTSLAMIIAAELGTPIRVTSGPAIERAGDLAALLTSLTDGEVLFIDEIHRIARPAEEMLYMAMEDFRVDVVVGKGPGATAIPLELAPFTLVGATTRAGLLTGPLRDRFGFTGHMDFYDADELEQVLTRSAELLRVDLRRTAPPRSPAGLAARRASPTGCCAGCATTPRSAPTASSPPRSPTPRWRSTTSTSSGWTGWTEPCWTPSCAVSAGDRSASAPSPSPWARRSRLSRRSPSRSWSAPACSPARRAGGSRLPPPGHIWVSACLRQPGRACSTRRVDAVKEAWPYVVVLLLLFGLLAISRRNRRRVVAQEMVRASQIGFGSEVMTTSGLYGTVTARNEDGTVQLAIAPGVEVKWALAALRDASSLPDQYRKGIDGTDDRSDDSARGISRPPRRSRRLQSRRLRNRRDLSATPCPGCVDTVPVRCAEP